MRHRMVPVGRLAAKPRMWGFLNPKRAYLYRPRVVKMLERPPGYDKLRGTIQRSGFL